MDIIAIVLLFVVLAVQVYVSFFKSAGPTGDDKSSVLLIEDLRRHCPDLPVLVLSMHDEPAMVRRALTKALAP